MWLSSLNTLNVVPSQFPDPDRGKAELRTELVSASGHVLQMTSKKLSGPKSNKCIILNILISKIDSQAESKSGYWQGALP
jgi:hypothetical protein